MILFIFLTKTTVRSLLWPGFVAYSDHFVFGYAYFGDGVKNSDFEFLLWFIQYFKQSLIYLAALTLIVYAHPSYSFLAWWVYAP